MKSCIQFPSNSTTGGDVKFPACSIELLHPKKQEAFQMNQTTIGKYIACKRKEQNLTQEQLAQQLGVPTTHLQVGNRQMYAGLQHHP